MSAPKVPLTNNIVEDTSGTSPVSGSSGGGSIGATGGNLAGLAGGAIGNKVGGATGATIGGAVGQAVGAAILGDGNPLPGSNAKLPDITSGGFAGPLSNSSGIRGKMLAASSGGFAGPMSPSSGGFAGEAGFGGMLRPPDANSAWFTFTAAAALTTSDFAVYSFTGYEEACKPYEFVIELVSRSYSADLTSLLGTPACLSIADRSGEKRLVHGLIREMKQLHTANVFTHYRATLVPRLAFLGQIRDHRIFQNLTVVEIIQKILKEQGFKGGETSFTVGQKLEPREFCLQYGETDLHFITRLCEEESIFFYFTHKEDSHCLCFYDYKGGPEIAGTPDIRFYPESGQLAETAVISRLELSHAVNSNAAMYKEWNFTKAKLDLTVNVHETDKAKAPTPPN